jgi:hypothetical protein
MHGLGFRLHEEAAQSALGVLLFRPFTARKLLRAWYNSLGSLLLWLCPLKETL